jgi:hypothetical protein
MDGASNFIWRERRDAGHQIQILLLFRKFSGCASCRTVTIHDFARFQMPHSSIALFEAVVL